MKKRWLFIILLTQLWLGACQPKTINQTSLEWGYADLRLLDASDCRQPDADILAIYTRRLGLTGFQIRLDMLDVDIHPDSDLHLAINYRLSGSRTLPFDAYPDIDWDYLVTVDANNGIKIQDENFNPQQNIAVSVFRDSFLDTITLNFQNDEFVNLPVDFSIQAFTTNSRSRTAIDSTIPAFFSDSPPKPALVLFGFWNVFPAYTPAQTIRRWDGAHSGPLGDRHGLYNLLRTFDSHSIPLVLLDLTSPASLSALDFGGDVDYVKELYASHKIILADTIPLSPIMKPTILPTWLQEDRLSSYQVISKNFGFPPSPFLFSQFNSPDMAYIANQYQLIFVPVTSEAITTTIRTIQGYRVIPIPVNRSQNLNDLQPGSNGPSLEMRKAFIASALEQKNTKSILILGGDLPQSSWADPQVARSSLEYINNHPWINILNKYDLLDIQPQKAPLTISTTKSINWMVNPTELLPYQNQILEQIQNMAEGQIKETALQMVDSLFSPAFPSPVELASLRANYWVALQNLLEAGRWEKNPTIKTQCIQEGNQNIPDKCILVSPQWYLSFDQGNACIRFGFFRLADGIHQIIAPGYQLMSAQSDPSFWNLAAGLRADPTLIPCAFDDTGGPYQVIAVHDRLIFTNPKSNNRKIYSLVSNSLLVEIHSNQSEEITIPLTLDPWIRFTPQWADLYQSNLIAGGWEWSLNPILRVRNSANASFSVVTFKDTQDKMATTEDPNAEKKPGLFLPFPMALGKIDGNPVITVTVSVLPESNFTNQP